MGFKKLLPLLILLGSNIGNAAHVTDRSEYLTDIKTATGTSVFKFPTVAPTASRVCTFNSDGEPVSSSVTDTTLSFLDATSSIQGQLNSITSSYVPYSGATGDVSLGSNAISAYSFNVPDHSTSGTGVLYYSNGAFQLTDGSSLVPVNTSALHLADPSMGGVGSVYLDNEIYNFRDAAGLNAATLAAYAVTASRLNLRDLTNPETSQLTVDQEIASFRLSGDLIDFKAGQIFGSAFRLYDGTVGEYSYLTISEGAFAAILTNGTTLADIAATKINPTAGVSLPAIHVVNRQLISGAEDIILDWSGGLANMAHGFFGGLSTDFSSGGYFNFTNGSVSQYATLTYASNDVNDEWGGSVNFSANPEEGINLSYSNGTGLQVTSSQVGLYISGGNKVIEATSGTLEIGTGLGLPINLNGSMVVPSGPIVLPDGLATNPSVQYTGLSSNTGLYLPAVDSFGISTNGVGRLIIDSGGHTGLGGGVTPTAYLHLRAGTAATNAAPLKFTSGTLNTTPEVGAVEFLSDKLYNVITTGAARKEITLNDIALTSGRVSFSTTNGRQTDDSDFTFATDTLTVTKIAATTFTGSPTLAANLITSGTAPTLSACGTSPSITGNDRSGLVTVGTGGIVSACTVSFNATYGAAPHCFANDRSEIVAVTVTAVSTTAFTISKATPFLASSVIDYFCVQ